VRGLAKRMDVLEARCGGQLSALSDAALLDELLRVTGELASCGLALPDDWQEACLSDPIGFVDCHIAVEPFAASSIHRRKAQCQCETCVAG
jgi:hypothetical protein